MWQRRLLFVALGCVMVAGCEDEEGVVGPSVIGMSISVTPTIDTIFANDTAKASDTSRVAARIYSSAAGRYVTGVPVRWSVSDPAVARVDSLGLVTAVSFGSATITASISANKEATTRIEVVPKTAAVSVTPATTSLFVDDPIVPGDTLRLRAVTRDRSGAVVTGTRMRWTSSAAAVASVDSAGVVRALSLGTTTISAVGNGVTGTATLTVRPLVKSVTLTAPLNRGLVSDTIQLSASAVAQDDKALAGRRFVWTSSNPSVATVDANGRVVLVGRGTAQVTATTGWVSSSTSVEALPRVLTTLDVGDEFVCGAANLGRGYCWGRGDLDQLGLSADSLCSPDLRPINVPCTLAPKRFAATVSLQSVSAGAGTACGIGVDNHIYCWGRDDLGQLGDGSRGTAVVDKVVRATVGNERFKAVSVGGRPTVPTFSQLYGEPGKVAEVGSAHACAISLADRIFCWGSDSSGQLGDARTINSSTPIPLDELYQNVSWSRVSAGGFHTCAITVAGDAYCWGLNNAGQLGTGVNNGLSQVPVLVSGGLRFREISAGTLHTCGVAVDGSVYCWGDGDNGKLGLGASADVLVPTQVPGLSSIVAISSGDAHTCAINSSGSAFCWGTNAWGQLGNGSASGTSTPTVVVGPQSFRQISAGTSHTCAIDTSDVAYCWGSNRLGTLGNELQAAFRTTPQRVAALR